MPDFLNQFGEQLRTAQATTPTERQTSSTGPHERLRLSRSVRRGVLVSVGVLAIATPALAIVQPWNPPLGRHGIDGPISADTSAVSPTARKAFAVVRRPQTTDDQTRAAPILRSGITDRVDGVQTAAVRALPSGWILVPAQSVQSVPGRTQDAQLCIADGEAIACGDADDAATAGIEGSAASTTQTTRFGLVPDGVTHVRFTPSDGSSAVEATVSSNFYTLHIGNGPIRRERMPAPEGYTRSKTIPPPPEPAGGTLDWLDQSGAVIASTN